MCGIGSVLLLQFLIIKLNLKYLNSIWTDLKPLLDLTTTLNFIDLFKPVRNWDMYYSPTHYYQKPSFW